MAAITGFSSVPDMNGSSRAGRRPPAAPSASDSFMSSPAQKARPVPVRMPTSSVSSSRKPAQVSARAVRSSWFRALRRSGRFMRTTRTCPWRSVSTTPITHLLHRAAASFDEGDLLRVQVYPDRVADLVHLQGRRRHPEPRAAALRTDDVVPGFAQEHALRDGAREHGPLARTVRPLAVQADALRPDGEQHRAAPAAQLRVDLRGLHAEAVEADLAILHPALQQVGAADEA